MVSRAFLAAILLAAFSLAPVLGADPGTKPATKKAGGARSAPSERTCALTITWWTAPTLAEGESLELGVQTDHGVTLIGETNLPALVAADASSLYARNVLDFLKLILNKEGALHIDLEDDIVAACLVTQGGEVRRK